MKKSASLIVFFSATLLLAACSAKIKVLNNSSGDLFASLGKLDGGQIEKTIPKGGQEIFTADFNLFQMENNFDIVLTNEFVGFLAPSSRTSARQKLNLKNGETKEVSITNDSGVVSLSNASSVSLVGLIIDDSTDTSGANTVVLKTTGLDANWVGSYPIRGNTRHLLVFQYPNGSNGYTSYSLSNFIVKTGTRTNVKMTSAGFTF